MKNRLCYIFGLFMCFIFAGNVYADGISISLEGNVNNINKGEKTDISIKLTSNKVISSCQFKVESTENLVFVEGSDNIPPNNWGKTGNMTDGYMLTRPNNESPNIPNESILKLTYTVNDSGSVTVKDIKCIVEEDSSEQIIENKEISITAIDAVDDMSLKSLVVKNGSAVPVGPGIESGLTTLSAPNFGLEIVTNNPSYQDKVVVKDKDGNVINDISNITFNNPTGQGQMVLYIIVNDSKPYELDVVYVEKKLDNSLEYIKINGENILKDGQVDYKLEVSNDVSNVEVVVKLKDSVNFQICENSSNINAETLKEIFSITDIIDINIVVEPKDSSSGATAKTYTINVKRKGAGVPENKDDEDTDGDSSIDTEIEEDVEVNPATSDISMFVMLLILISSLVVSVILYRKNLESYK